MMETEFSDETMYRWERIRGANMQLQGRLWDELCTEEVSGLTAEALRVPSDVAEQLGMSDSTRRRALCWQVHTVQADASKSAAVRHGKLHGLKCSNFISQNHVGVTCGLSLIMPICK